MGISDDTTERKDSVGVRLGAILDGVARKGFTEEMMFE